MDVERTKRPTLVNLSLSGSRLPSASRSSVIVLNLITLKILASFPGRSCVKNAPAPLLAKCSQMVIINNIGQMIVNTQKTRIKDDLGIDSLNMMLVAVEIEDEYGIEFDGSQSPDTVGELIDYIQARVAAKENG